MLTNARIIGANIRNADYQSQSAKRGDPDYRISRSDLVDIAENAHKWRAGGREERSDGMDWGSMLDAALCGQFASTYAALPETYTDEKGAVKPYNANSTICKSAKAGIEAYGLIPVKRSEVNAVEQAVAILRDDYDATALLHNAETQVMIHADWRDKATGLTIPLRALIDILPDVHSAVSLNFQGGMAFATSGTIVDLKTAGNASPKAWPRYCYDYSCHVQSAFYLDLYEAATKEGRSTFIHLIQESKPPYELGKRVISQQFVELGRWSYSRALSKYAECLKLNHWHGYDDDGFSLTEPEAWMVAASEACA